jgi:hypothetical protein
VPVNLERCPGLAMQRLDYGLPTYIWLRVFFEDTTSSIWIW